MSLSLTGLGQADQATRVQLTSSPIAAQGGGSAKKSAGFGSTPAAVVTLSAQAKAVAIKNGHDPDGIQDGK